LNSRTARTRPALTAGPGPGASELSDGDKEVFDIVK